MLSFSRFGGSLGTVGFFAGWRRRLVVRAVRVVGEYLLLLLVRREQNRVVALAQYLTVEYAHFVAALDVYLTLVTLEAVDMVHAVAQLEHLLVVQDCQAAFVAISVVSAAVFSITLKKL